MTTDPRPLAAVTGASSGIGYELARQFAAHGFDLVLPVHVGPLGETRRACEALGARVDEVPADLATYAGVEALAARITATGRPLEALALNAGVGLGGDFARQTALDDELRLIQLNVVSTVHLAKRVLPAMVARGRGRLLFTSSVEALTPGPLQAVYAASKAFVSSFAEALREELKDSGVTVTSLLPGATDTNFFARAGLTTTPLGKGPKDDPAVVARQGFEAMMAGKDRLVAGSPLNKAVAALSAITPEPLKAAIFHRLSEPADGEG